MPRGLRKAADLADERIRAAVGAASGAGVAEQRDMWDLLPCFTDLPIEASEALAYSAWVAPDSARFIREGSDPEEIIIALVARTVLATVLALQEGD